MSTNEMTEKFILGSMPNYKPLYTSGMTEHQVMMEKYMIGSVPDYTPGTYTRNTLPVSRFSPVEPSDR